MSGIKLFTEYELAIIEDHVRPFVEKYTHWFAATVDVTKNLNKALDKIQLAHNLLNVYVIECINYGAVMRFTSMQVIHYFRQGLPRFYTQNILLNRKLSNI